MLPGARASHNNHSTYWVACGGKVYVLNRNIGGASPNEVYLDKLTLGASPSITQLGTATGMSGAALSAFQCVEGKVYVAIDINPSVVRTLTLDTATDTFAAGPVESMTGTYSGFIKTAAGDLFTYYQNSTSAMQRLELPTANATAVLESKPMLTTGGRPMFFDGFWHESTSRGAAFTRSGTAGHIDFFVAAPATMVDTLTNAATAYAPTFSYAPSFNASVGVTGVSGLNACTAGGRALVWTYAGNFATNNFVFAGLVLNANGTRFAGFNSGNELSFNHAPYNYFTGMYYGTVTCDAPLGYGAFTYKNASGQPVINLLNLGVP
jgi:hypothetical protein